MVGVGFNCPNKTQHKQLWGQVAEAAAKDCLPEKTSLEEMLEALEDDREPRPQKRRRGAEKTPGIHAEDLLGGRAPHVPVEVHEQMLELAGSGSLPLTTQPQRARQRMSAGTDYGTPAGMQEGVRAADACVARWKPTS